MLNVLSLRTEGWQQRDGRHFFWISYFFCLCCPATVKRLENQKEHYRGITGTGNPGIFQCHLVEWFVSSLAEWSYITSAVPYLNRKTINQPAQPQQHNDFLPSEDDKWWFTTDFKSPQIVKSSFFLKRDGTVVSRTLELVLCGLAASPCKGFLQPFPSIINFSEQGVGILILCL